MAEETAPLTERLAALRSDYIHALPGRMLAIESAWRRLSDVAWDPTLLADLHRLVHGLSGSGATFGLEAVSIAARVLEQHLKTAIAAGKPASDPERVQVSEALRQLRQVIDAVVSKPLSLLDPPQTGR